MRFADVQHQARAIGLIRRALAGGRMHHGLLFEGPEGVGKELAARALAARLLCHAAGLAPDADACGTCPACRMLASETHPDFQLVHRGLYKQHPDPRVRKTKGLFLTVDLVRHFVIDASATKPSQGARRVFIIRDAERMNEDAQNCLLKTLEEPPESSTLILLTSAAVRLLPTIRSRCQRIPFDRLPLDFVAKSIGEHTQLTPASARSLAFLSDGRLGIALRGHTIGLLDALERVSELLAARGYEAPEAFGKSLVEFAESLATRARKADAGQSPEIEVAASNELDNEDEDADADEEDGEKDAGPRAAKSQFATDERRDALKLVLGLVAATYREALVLSAGAAGLRGLPGLAAPERLAQDGDVEALESAIRACSTAEWMLDRNVNPQLACERMAVALADGGVMA